MPGLDILHDVQRRFRCYCADWREGLDCGLRITAPSLYIFFASVLPALAFGQQLALYTKGALNVVHVLYSTLIAGVLQSVVGGQPLLIVGVAEPIVIIYSFMFKFAEKQPALGADLFLPWAAWVCVWTALFVVLLAVFGACRFIDRFTRFSDELFGMLIAILFMQQGIIGAIEEFGVPKMKERQPPEADAPHWRLVNGLWGLMLAFGLVLTSLKLDTARSWRYGTRGVRGLLADYGAPAMVVAWSGLSFALRGTPGNIPRRVDTPRVWEVLSGWDVAERMRLVPGNMVAAALVPAICIAVLFYFDHNVSSRCAQEKDFNLKKPSAYHYDMFLLGLMTLVMGLLGLPPVNGVLPQAPMHTRTLATLAQTLRQQQPDKEAATKSSPGGGCCVVRRKGATGTATTHGSSSPSAPSATAGAEELAAGSPAPAATVATTVIVTSSSGAALQTKKAAHAEFGSEELGCAAAVENVIISDAPQAVCEQRLSNLLQSVLVGACLAATPAIQKIPKAVLWGYFAYMALASLGSQFWQRLLLLFTDATQRRQGMAGHLHEVPFKVTVAFTLLQLAYLAGVWALVTWAGIVGIAFPIPIMALVPLRLYLLPRLFKQEHLRLLDPVEYELQQQALPPAEMRP